MIMGSESDQLANMLHGLFCAFVLAPASFLTFGKVNPGPPQTDIFLGEGGPSPPPPSFFSAPGPDQTDILLGGGGRPSPLLALFLTLGKVNCHGHLGGREKGASD